MSASIQQQDLQDIRSSNTLQEWFGDSKIVDDKGKPLAVYHGTGSRFDTFKTPSYFTADEAMALDYSSNQEGEIIVVCAYLRITNPKIVSTDYIEWAGYETEEIEAAKAEGFDGFMNQSMTEIVIFNHEQIKTLKTHRP